MVKNYSKTITSVISSMRYIKQIREKVGECTICRRRRQLTYDHIPPKIAGNINPMVLVSALTALSGKPQEDRPLISQDGFKIRSICRDCNSTLGTEYDPVIGELCKNINQYLNSRLTLPTEANFDTIPSRLLRGLLGHLLAAKLRPTGSVIDNYVREYLADHASALNPELHAYYWLYPYRNISVLRDFGMGRHVQEGRETNVAIFGSVLKFLPLGFFLTEEDYFHGLPDLSKFSHFGIDDPGRITLRFDKPKPIDWPEGTSYSMFLLTGQSGNESLSGSPRRI